MPSSPPLFGTVLRQLRKRERLSQIQLAHYLHSDRAIVSSLETGKHPAPHDPSFYDQLRAVPGFSDADITRLREAAETNRAIEDLQKLLDQYKATLEGIHKNLGSRLRNPQPDAPREIPLEIRQPGLVYKEAPEILTESSYKDDLIRLWDSEKGANPAQTLVKPEVDPLPHVEKELQPSSQPEQGQAPRKDVVYIRKSRSHYDHEYLQENADTIAQRLVAAVRDPTTALSPIAAQALHDFAEAEAKTKGASLSQISQEKHINLSNLSRWVAQDLVSVHYKDKGTTYLADETIEEITRITQQSSVTGERPSRLLRELRNKRLQEEVQKQQEATKEATPQVIYEKASTPDKRDGTPTSPQSYEIVTSLQEASEKFGVPAEDILTTEDVQAEFNLSKERIHGWTRGGRDGQPNLMPLPFRLGGGKGAARQLFLRADVEWRVANPPQGGRPPK